MWSSLCFCRAASKDLFRSSALLNSCCSAPDLVKTFTPDRQIRQANLLLRQLVRSKAFLNNLWEIRYDGLHQSLYLQNITELEFLSHSSCTTNSSTSGRRGSDIMVALALATSRLSSHLVVISIHMLKCDHLWHVYISKACVFVLTWTQLCTAGRCLLFISLWRSITVETTASLSSVSLIWRPVFGRRKRNAKGRKRTFYCYSN